MGPDNVPALNSNPLKSSQNVNEDVFQELDIQPPRRRKGSILASLNVNNLIAKIDGVQLLVKMKT